MKKTENFFKQAAKASWICPLLVLGMGYFTQDAFKSAQFHYGPIILSFFIIFMFMVGIVAGIVALFGVKHHGKTGILIPAIIGLLLNILFSVIIVTVAFAAFMSKISR
jgi:hypothetical protein